MSTYDAKARMEQMDRELDEYVEAIRMKHKGEMRPAWVLLGFGMFCSALGFILGISL